MFKPGDGPCWTCLFDRMIRNREVKGFLDRGPARAVAISPLVHGTLGQSGIQFAALEVAKAIATDFHTDLNNHIVSQDLLGASMVKHYVAKRPQCPTCGSRMLRDPRRAPAPIEISGGAKLVMTSGGFRSVSSRATVARHRKHVSALTGVVTKLERIEADLPMNTNYFAKHNFSAPAQNVDQLRSGLSGGSFGKGSTAEQAEASALMESIERYSGIFQSDEIRMTRRYTDFAPGEAILPNDVLLFSEAQARADRSEHNHSETQPAPEPFDPSAKIEWSPVWSLRDGCFRYLPTSLLYFFYSGPAAFQADSNGCAAGNTVEEAIVQGFLELVERDAYAIWWYNQSQRNEVDLGQFDDSYVRDLQSQLADTGAIVGARRYQRSWRADLCRRSALDAKRAGKHRIRFRCTFRQAHCAVAHADRAEPVPVDRIHGRRHRREAEPRWRHAAATYELSFPDADQESSPAVRPGFGVLDNTRDQVMTCVDIARRAGLDFLVLNQTRPDLEVPVVRVIVPGLRHFYRRFAPGRLYDVPVKLGLRDRPIPESELTPFLPHS